jgi:hypothetical protein
MEMAAFLATCPGNGRDPANLHATPSGPGNH